MADRKTQLRRVARFLRALSISTIVCVGLLVSDMIFLLSEKPTKDNPKIEPTEANMLICSAVDIVQFSICLSCLIFFGPSHRKPSSAGGEDDEETTFNDTSTAASMREEETFLPRLSVPAVIAEDFVGSASVSLLKNTYLN